MYYDKFLVSASEASSASIGNLMLNDKLCLHTWGSKFLFSLDE